MDSIKAKTGSLFKGNNTKVSMILTPPSTELISLRP